MSHHRHATTVDLSTLHEDVPAPFRLPGASAGGAGSSRGGHLRHGLSGGQNPAHLGPARGAGARKRRPSRRRMNALPFAPQARSVVEPDEKAGGNTPNTPVRKGSLVGNSEMCHSDSGKRKPLSEVQLTKKFLQTEIDARMSRRLWVPTSRGGDEGNGEGSGEQGERKVFVVSARLPFTVILHEGNAKERGGDRGGGRHHGDEEGRRKGTADEEERRRDDEPQEGQESSWFSYESDPFDMNVADLLASTPMNNGGRGAGKKATTNVVLVGEPTVRKSDGSSVTITETLQEELDAFLRSELPVVPVFPPPNRDCFATRMIFQLFHYSMPSAETGLGSHDWEGYELVNEIFRDTLLPEITPGDLVWINDYPLMLLPKMLRQERPDICIGFYLHCVFPSSEVYRILPQREEILRGVLSSNIIGFHNFEYAQQFLNSCIHVLGLECSASCIEVCEDAGGTTTKVVTIQLGLHIEPYRNVLNELNTQSRIEQFQRNFQDVRLLLAVDRLEEEKGIPHKIMAFHKLLQKDPQWANKCIFLQIVLPPEKKFRDEDAIEDPDPLEHQQEQILQQAYLMCGEVNSKFGTIGHLPVHFLCQEFDPVDLVALYAMADVMIDTPLRDMLSRSAYEFHCCQEEGECGVLLLSEFSGSAQSLRAAALTVNPWDTNAFADAIQEALEMDINDRVELHRYGKQYVQEQTLAKWASNFLDELETAEEECERERLQIPPQLDHERPVAAMRKSNRRIIILGFLGTLVPHKSFLMTNISVKVPPVLRTNLQVIASAPNTHIVILSDFGRHQLGQALQSVPCWLIAEGGACYRERNSDVWQMSGEQRDTEWLGPVKDIMQYFTDRTPGSKVVEMSSSVSWVYNNIQGDHAAIQSKDLLVHLWAGPLHSAPAEAVVEKDSVTVRPTGTGKATILERLLQQICADKDSNTGELDERWYRGDTLVMCIGDFNVRDEDIYSTVQKQFLPDGITEQQQGQHGAEQAEISFGDLSPAWGDVTGVEWEPSRGEVHNLEANSLSLGSGLDFSSTRFGALHQVQFGDDGVSLDDSSIPKKSPSETDLPAVGHAADHPNPRRAADPEDKGAEGTPTLITCTVSKKATRAAYRLSDVYDVSFLIAQLAREVRQEKRQIKSSGLFSPQGGSTSAPTSLSSLFAGM